MFHLGITGNIDGDDYNGTNTYIRIKVLQIFLFVPGNISPSIIITS
jgi:hypothetical protein